MEGDSMANQEHLDILKLGWEAWYYWRKTSEEYPDLGGASLSGMNLAGFNFENADLSGSVLSETNLENANLENANLKNCYLQKANLNGANLQGAHLEGSDLSEAKLKRTLLSAAYLQGAILKKVDLDSVTLWRTHLEDADLSDSCLKSAFLSGTFFDGRTNLSNLILSDGKHCSVSLVDVNWGGVNLSIIEDWGPVKMLGNERIAREKMLDGKVKDKTRRVAEYRTAIRANRQLTAVLRDQGMNEEADRFAYRAQALKRQVLWLQLLSWQWIYVLIGLVVQHLVQLFYRIRKWGVWKQFMKLVRWQQGFWFGIKNLFSFLFSLFLDVLAGYGYKPGRAVLWYLLVILGFAWAYSSFGHLPFLPDALVFSLTSFHGRGFFPGLGNAASLHNPLVVAAAFEAVIGLLIEISFIATFTQRFFGR